MENSPNVQFHRHNGTDAAKVIFTDMELLDLIPQPSSDFVFNEGQLGSFSVASIGIYTRALGWNTLSFINSYVTSVSGNGTLGTGSTLQLFTGTPTTDNLSQMVSGTFTSKVQGFFRIATRIKVDQDSELQIKKNGTIIARTTGNTGLSLQNVVQLLVGDTLTVELKNISGSSLSYTGGVDSELSIVKITNM